MGLYRQIAGESLGLFLEAADVEMYNGGSGGGGGGTVFYDPGIPIPIAVPTAIPMITPSQPLQPDDQPANVIPTNGTTTDNPVNSNTTAAEAVQTATTANSSSTPAAATPLPGGTQEKNWWPAISLGVLMINMVYGERLLGKYRSAAFVGGLGALYYGLSQIKKQDTPTPIT